MLLIACGGLGFVGRTSQQSVEQAADPERRSGAVVGAARGVPRSGLGLGTSLAGQ
jgi:hypothetical protein